jgi:hypothetical protein
MIFEEKDDWARGLRLQLFDSLAGTQLIFSSYLFCCNWARPK